VNNGLSHWVFDWSNVLFSHFSKPVSIFLYEGNEKMIPTVINWMILFGVSSFFGTDFGLGFLRWTFESRRVPWALFRPSLSFYIPMWRVDSDKSDSLRGTEKRGHGGRTNKRVWKRGNRSKHRRNAEKVSCLHLGWKVVLRWARSVGGNAAGHNESAEQKFSSIESYLPKKNPKKCT